MTITVVCRKSKIAWLFLPCVLLLASCGKRQVTKSATVEAQQTAGKIRQGWATACRPLTITSEGMETGLPDIGVYMHLADATDTERNAFYGVPFIYDNGRYVAQKHHTVTADTLAAIYACFPYRQGLAADDSLVLAAPFGENLYAVETARHIGKEISVEMDWRSSMVLLCIGCESDRLQERLDELTLTGENLCGQAVSFHDKLKRRQCKISSSNVCQVVLRYTKSCNLSCSYCYAHTDLKPPTSMSNETVLYILRKLSKSYPEKVLNLSFHGGEPLLNYNKLVPLVKEIRKISENIKFYIQTNGTLVTKEIAGFLKAENFNVGISIDGFDTASNSHRCQLNGSSSLKQSLIGLDYLLAAGISPGMFTVVTAANQYKLLDHFDFYVGKGIKKFNFSPILHSGKAADKKYDVNINHLIETNLKLMEKINLINNECNNIEDYISEVNISNLLNNLSSLNIYNLCTLAPCGAGHTMLGFDIDGSFYSCDYFIGNLEFKIGNIYEVDDIKNSIFRNPSVQNLLKRNIDSIKECRMCTWKNVCTYHCASDSYFNHKTLYKPHSMCEYVKKIIPRIIDLLYRKKISINNIPPC